MSKKKFNYGDLVIKKSQTYFDGVFGLDNGDIGVIVGSYECDELPEYKDYISYRVYYNDRSSYVGEFEHKLEKYEGEVPEYLKNVTWNDIKYIDFELS